MHKRNRKYPKEFLVGLLAHELCHLEYWQRYPFEYSFIFGFKRLSKKFVIENEKQTDYCAIEKGYGKKLYLQRKSRWDEVSNGHRTKKVYLSPEKIKLYAKKIGKW